MIDWEGIIAAGALEFVQAFGKAAGEDLGHAFVARLLGQDAGNQDLAEVQATLTRVEAKLDWLTRYVVDTLPGLVYDAAIFAELKIHADKFHAAQTDALAQIAALRASKNPGKMAQGLSDATNNMLNLAHTLMISGPHSYLIAMHAMTVAMSAYAELVQVDKAYGHALQVRATDWLKITSPWLDESQPGTIPAELKTFKDALSYANTQLARFPNGVVPHFVAAVFGPTKTINQAINLPMWELRLVIAYLDRRTAAGSWTGGDPFSVTRQFFEEVRADDWGKLLADPVSAGGQRPIKLDWWEPLKAMPPGWHFGDLREQSARRYNELHSQSAFLPGKIEAATNMLKTILQLNQTCRIFAEAK